MRLKDLIKNLPINNISDDLLDKFITNISCDINDCDENSLFLAIQGHNHHGLDFYQNQPVAVIFYQEYGEKINLPDNAVKIDNLTGYLSKIAGNFYHHPSKKLTITGITGTDGKSSIAHLLTQANDGAMIGTIGYGKLNNLKNSSNTTPNPLLIQSILNDFVDQGIQNVAIECSSHGLIQNRISDLTITNAVFTNLSREHLDYHSNMNDYFLAKAKLFQFSIKNAIINIKDSYGRRLIDEKLINKNAEIISYSSDDKIPYYKNIIHFNVSNVTYLNNGLSFLLNKIVNNQIEQIAINSDLLGKFNLDNLLALSAVLFKQGKSLVEIANIIKNLTEVCGRVEKVLLPNNRLILIDYAHTPAAIKNVVLGVRKHIAGKLWLICGCGGNRDVGKRRLMGEMASKLSDFAIFTDDNPRNEQPEKIINMMLEGVEDKNKVIAIRPRDEAIRWAIEQMQPNDCLIIAGKGHEQYQIIGSKNIAFSDLKVVKNYINQRVDNE